MILGRGPKNASGLLNLVIKTTRTRRVVLRIVREAPSAAEQDRSVHQLVDSIVGTVVTADDVKNDPGSKAFRSRTIRTRIAAGDAAGLGHGFGPPAGHDLGAPAHRRRGRRQ